MAKEILLYDYIYSYSVADVIRQMEDAKNDDIVFRVNTPGGEVMAAYGIYAKYAELTKGKLVKVDGAADSCGAFLCCYAENVECLDVSTFLFHRASYGIYFESSDLYFTDGAKESLKKVNDNLRAALEGKVKEADFKRETGISYDDLFSLETRIDVEVSSAQALRMGLVQSVVKITPEKKAEVSALRHKVAASSRPIPESTKENLTPNKMTIEKLKAEHPDLYAAAVKEGVTQERDRVGSYLAFNHLDPEAVKKGIESGENLSATAMANFSLKAFSKQALNAAEQESAADVTTPEAEKQKPEAEKQKEQFVAATRNRLGLK